MADLREALKRTIKAIRAHSRFCVHTHNDICDEFDAMLTAHPPDEAEKLLARVRALAVDWDQGGFPAWTFARDLREILADPKPTTEPDTPKATIAPSNEVREANMALDDAVENFVFLAGQIRDTRLSGDTIRAFIKAVANYSYIEARAAGRKP